MQHAVADLEVFGGRDRMQVLHRERHVALAAATDDRDLDLPADAIVEQRVERLEIGHRLALGRDEDVADRELAVGIRARLDFGDDEHAGARRRRLARLRLDGRRQPEAPQLVVGRVTEDRLQRAASHRLLGLDQLERAHDAPERQVEARRGARRTAGVEREHAAADVEHGRAGRSARRARGGLVIERVEVVVAADAVFRRLAIEPRERSGEDRELLARVVADDADLDADLRAFRIQRQLGGLDEPELLRVVAIEAEVVHGIAIHRLELDFLAIEECRDGLHRARRDDVPVRQDQAALGVDHEAGRLRRRVPLRVEGARCVDLDRDHAGRDPLERPGPARGLLELERLRQRHDRQLRRERRKLLLGRLRLARDGGSRLGRGLRLLRRGLWLLRRGLRRLRWRWRRRQRLRLGLSLCARERGAN